MSPSSERGSSDFVKAITPRESSPSCSWIHADANGSPSCLYPNPRYPRDIYAKNFESPFVDKECAQSKLLVSYVRAYRMAYWGNMTLAAMNSLPEGAKKIVWELDYHTFIPENVGWVMDPFVPIPQELRKWFGAWQGINAKLSLRAFFGPYKYENWAFVNGVFLTLLDVFLNGWGGKNCTFILEPGTQPTKGWGWTYCEWGNKLVHLVVQHFVNSSTSLLASTICHELLHCHHGVDDQPLNGGKAYLPENCRILGYFDSSKAIKNNDNYAFWLYGMYFAWSQSCNIFRPFTYGGKTYTFDMKSLSWNVK